jgi:hypothetical protein
MPLEVEAEVIMAFAMVAALLIACASAAPRRRPQP